MKRIFIVSILILSFTFIFAQEDERKPITDREIVERLTRLEEGQKNINKRIDDLDDKLSGRTDDIDNKLSGRINDLDNKLSGRINDLDNKLSERIDTLQNMMWVLLAGMFALVGFVIWDRRSALSPVITRNKELEEREEKLERALKEYSNKDPELKKILKSIGLL